MKANGERRTPSDHVLRLSLHEAKAKHQTGLNLYMSRYSEELNF